MCVGTSALHGPVIYFYILFGPDRTDKLYLIPGVDRSDNRKQNQARLDQTDLFLLHEKRPRMYRCKKKCIFKSKSESIQIVKKNI